MPPSDSPHAIVRCRLADLLAEHVEHVALVAQGVLDGEAGRRVRRPGEGVARRQQGTGGDRVGRVLGRVVLARWDEAVAEQQQRAVPVGGDPDRPRRAVGQHAVERSGWERFRLLVRRCRGGADGSADREHARRDGGRREGEADETPGGGPPGRPEGGVGGGVSHGDDDRRTRSGGGTRRPAQLTVANGRRGCGQPHPGRRRAWWTRQRLVQHEADGRRLPDAAPAVGAGGDVRRRRPSCSARWRPTTRRRSTSPPSRSRSSSRCAASPTSPSARWSCGAADGHPVGWLIVTAGSLYLVGLAAGNFGEWWAGAGHLDTWSAIGSWAHDWTWELAAAAAVAALALFPDRRPATRLGAGAARRDRDVLGGPARRHHRGAGSARRRGPPRQPVRHRRPRQRRRSGRSRSPRPCRGRRPSSPCCRSSAATGRPPGAARQQLRWLCGTVIAFLIGAVVVAVAGLFGVGLVFPLFLFVLVALPGAMAAAILRDHLYGIDVIVDRVVVYTLLATLIAAVCGRRDAARPRRCSPAASRRRRR